ncbi:hypothetical protein [Variovorax paradoxus]|uniref:hypothetical protein n=1 Tax=Variovorax paradoxus TaxID=34073 RepID=UPI003D6608FD
MTLFDLLWDWRTLMALSVVDAFLVVMFFAWDAKHLALLTRRCNLGARAAAGDAASHRPTRP